MHYLLGYSRSLSMGNYLDKYFGVKMKKKLWRASTHYLFNAWVGKGDMLPNDAHCSGLEAYKRGVTWTNLVGRKWEKRLKLFGGCQCIISSMIRWRKVICY